MSDNGVQTERTIWDQPNTMFPHRPDYQSPVWRGDPQHHFPLTAPVVKREGTVVERAEAALENAAHQFEKHLNTVDMTLYTNEGAKQRTSEFTRTEAAKAVDTGVDQVRQRRDKAAANVENLRRELSPAGDTATELRNSRTGSEQSRSWTKSRTTAGSTVPVRRSLRRPPARNWAY